MNAAVLPRLLELAGEVGRARRHCEGESSLAFSLERIADGVESIDGMLRPTAGQLVSWSFPGDAEAAEAALEVVA